MQTYIEVWFMNVLYRVLDAHPAVGRVAQYVTSLLTTETTSPRRSHHVSYSMDSLSDDDEMDADQVMSSFQFLYLTLLIMVLYKDV